MQYDKVSVVLCLHNMWCRDDTSNVWNCVCGVPSASMFVHGSCINLVTSLSPGRAATMATDGMQGRTALMCAAARGHATVVKMLLAHHADVHAANDEVSHGYALLCSPTYCQMCFARINCSINMMQVTLGSVCWGAFCQHLCTG